VNEHDGDEDEESGSVGEAHSDSGCMRQWKIRLLAVTEKTHVWWIVFGSFLWQLGACGFAGQSGGLQERYDRSYEMKVGVDRRMRI
jgi:hypothetical protein